MCLDLTFGEGGKNESVAEDRYIVGESPGCLFRYGDPSAHGAGGVIVVLREGRED